MKTIKDLIEFTGKREGFRALPYKCSAGALTVGKGFNLDAGMSEPESDVLLAIRLFKVEKD